MKALRSFALAIATSSSITACTPAAQPAAVEPVPATTPAAPAVVVAAPVVQARSVSIQALVGAQALASATVSVRLVSDLSVVADGLTTDDQGRITLSLDSRLTPGTQVLVTARSATSVLSGLFAVPHPLTVQQAGPAPDWLLDIATSVVARKLTSKVADVLRSLPSTGNAAPLSALRDQVRGLVDKTREALRHDASLSAALQTTLASPTKSHLDTLANHAVMTPALQPHFVDVVKACNRVAYENMAAGGPLVQPATWQVNLLVVVPPQLRVVGANQIELTYEARRSSLTVPNAAGAVSEAVKRSTDTSANAVYADFNSTITVGGGGSSGGGSGGATQQQPSLQGVVSVGGTARGAVMVQLNSVSGAVIAKSATAADGAYAFYDIPDGVYHLIVATDGAVQATQAVTIGTP